MSEELNQVTEDMKNIEQNLTAILSRERFEDGDLKELAKLKDEVENNLLKKTDEIASKIAESNVVLNNLEPEIQREHDFVEKVKVSEFRVESFFTLFLIVIRYYKHVMIINFNGGINEKFIYI